MVSTQSQSRSLNDRTNVSYICVFILFTVIGMNLILQVGTQADLPPVPPGKFEFSFELECQYKIDFYQ